MPGRAALPAALVSDLTQAWQASIAADQAYAKWANDEITQGCVANDTSDPGYQATVTPNANATKYKTAFVGQWNPVAAQYGLTRTSRTSFSAPPTAWRRGRPQRIAVQMMDDRALIVSMPYCSVGLPVLNTATR